MSSALIFINSIIDTALQLLSQLLRCKHYIWIVNISFTSFVHHTSYATHQAWLGWFQHTYGMMRQPYDLLGVLQWWQHLFHEHDGWLMSTLSYVDSTYRWNEERTSCWGRSKGFCRSLHSAFHSLEGFNDQSRCKSQ